MSPVTDRTTRPARPAQVRASLPLLLVTSVIGLGLVFLGGYRGAYSAGLAGTPGAGAGDHGPISLPDSLGWLALILFGLMLTCSLPSALLGRRAAASPGAARAAGRLGFAVFALFVGAGVFGVMALVLSFTSS